MKIGPVARHTWRPVLTFAAAMAALVPLLFATQGGTGQASNPATGGEAPVAIEEPRRVTALLLGLDRRPPPHEDPDGANRADVIELVTYDPKTGETTLIGVPRDTWVSIPGVGQNRVNTAYFWAVSATGRTTEGLNAAKQTIESNFGVAIDFVVAVDFASFIELTDDLGGVPIEIPESLDNYRVSAPFIGPGIRLRAGRQVGTGEYLLAAARARPDGDLRRIERAQSILTGIFTRLRSMNLFEMASFLVRHGDTVETTLSPLQWPSLVRLALQADPARTRYYSVGDHVSPWTTPDGAAVLLPNMGAIDAMMDEIFGDDRP